MADSALGMGLDALIRNPTKKKEEKKKEKTKQKTETTKKSGKNKKSNKNTNNNIILDEEKIEEIRSEVEKNPRISLWSTKSAACLKYLKKTTPEFSISNEASIILDEAIKNKYPEIWELFEDL